MMERRFVKGAKVSVRAAASAEEKPGIQGYGAVFDEEYVLYDGGSYRVVETIKPGAFARVLKEKQDTRCLFNHSADNVLGRTTNETLRLKQDKQGLSYENDLDLRTTVAQNVQAFIDRGDVTGCSFAFTVSAQSWREEKKDGVIISTREIEEIDNLFDVGPVTYPAYEGTSVAGRSSAAALEARSRVLAIDGLPAEVRSRIERGKKKDEAECNCRCVACDKGDCEKCADHMVDCGDEKNCACMSSRSAAPGKKRVNVGSTSDCQCTCDKCVVGDCENCNNDDCKGAEEGCDHEGDDADRAAALSQVNERLRRAGMSPVA